MAATTTAFNDLLKQLRTDFADLTFESDESFRWSPSARTVYYDPKDFSNTPLLLHEAAHGVLGHQSYDYDIDLLKLERQAWNKAHELGEHYGVAITDETVEDAIDSYRDWLHARSTCPSCSRNGIQSSSDTYECLVCSEKWQVNDARSCGLRRSKITQK